MPPGDRKALRGHFSFSGRYMRKALIADEKDLITNENTNVFFCKTRICELLVNISTLCLTVLKIGAIL